MSAGSDKIEVLLDSFAKQQRTNDVLTQKVKIAKMKLEKENENCIQLTSQLNELNEKNSELEQQISLLSANRDALAVQISETKRKNSSMSITQKSIQTAIAQLKKDEIIEIEITKDSLEILRQRRTQFDEMAQKIAADPELASKLGKLFERESEY